jgi:hypothetical protein
MPRMACEGTDGNSARNRRITMRSEKQRRRRKDVNSTLWADSEWRVVEGRLTPPPGRPPKTSRLFQYVAEKLPYECLNSIKAHLAEQADHLAGVYLAHDSMGIARYGGRGQIFNRLAAHKQKYPKQLLYFSFYIIANKAHEREIETAILRAAGPQMMLNIRKVRNGIEVGNVLDYEPGTKFFERQRTSGRRPLNCEPDCGTSK